MEFTSDEILSHSFIQQTDKQLQDELSYVLKLSDLVKFAKVIPHNSEHELSFKNAVCWGCLQGLGIGPAPGNGWQDAGGRRGRC